MAIVINAYQQLINYLAEKATPEELLTFNLSEDEQERAGELPQKMPKTCSHQKKNAN